MNKNIEWIIKTRCNLQTTRRLLEYDFDIPRLNINKDIDITNRFILKKYQLMDENKKKRFLITIGGPKNLKSTKEFIESLISP